MHSLTLPQPSARDHFKIVAGSCYHISVLGYLISLFITQWWYLTFGVFSRISLRIMRIKFESILHLEFQSQIWIYNRCHEFCAQGGYRYYGVEARDWCHCGNNAPPASFKAHDIKCNEHPCPGDEAYNCGGGWRSHVYEISSGGISSKYSLFPWLCEVPTSWGTGHQTLFSFGVHAVSLMRDTSIGDMVKFSKQTKGHVVEVSICSDLAMRQLDSNDPNFCTTAIFWCFVEWTKITL